MAAGAEPIDPTSRKAGNGSRLVAVLGIVLAASALALGAANCALAVGFPLELEAREGTSWLHVLAIQAGVPIYDHARVAFMNMNHGPLDPLLKYILHLALPFLSPAMVTRFFVPLFPLALFMALRRALAGRLIPALVVTGGLYLLLLGLAPFHLLIGRSDPAALTFLALMLVALDASMRAAAAPSGRGTWAVCIAGLLGGAVFLINWRYLPGVILGGLAWLAELAWRRGHGTGEKWAFFGRHLAVFAGGLALPFLVILLAVFHGDVSTYYTHFVGYFLPDGSSDTVTWKWLFRGHYLTPPKELLTNRWLVHGLFLAAALVVVATTRDRRERRLQLLLWGPAFLAIWILTAHSYDLNRAGGGLYYFAPLYVLAAFHLARSFPPSAWAGGKWPAVAALLLLAGGLPWTAAWHQTRLMAHALEPARAFLREERRLTAGATVRSEDLYLFEDRYNGEIIDMGDSVFRELRVGTFGARFDDTAWRYFEQLPQQPPQFILMGSGVRVVSPLFDEFAAKYYDRILLAPEHLWCDGGGGAVLLRLRAGVHPEPVTYPPPL
ncbi:MAG TPA: hypothetical protein VG838_04865 [Opitutaceae bacterium]|nr:hypothetical protein [Opitutaceae bacterium]